MRVAGLLVGGGAVTPRIGSLVEGGVGLADALEDSLVILMNKMVCEL